MGDSSVLKRYGCVANKLRTSFVKKRIVFWFWLSLLSGSICGIWKHDFILRFDWSNVGKKGHILFLKLSKNDRYWWKLTKNVDNKKLTILKKNGSEKSGQRIWNKWLTILFSTKHSCGGDRSFRWFWSHRNTCDIINLSQLVK